MNAGKLIDFVRTFVRADVPGAELPATGHILDLLNQAQFEASNELGLPSKYLEVTGQVTPFNLPADAQETSPVLELKYVLSDGKTKSLPVLSVERASLEYPAWQQDNVTGEPEIAIYGTGVTGIQDVYVYPNPGAADYFVFYKVQPADMNELSDEPFNGELDRFHIMLAHYVTFMLNNNDQRFAIYRDMMSRAAGVRQRGPKVRQNAAYYMKGRYYS